MAAKLHEILAVEQDVAGAYKSILEETRKVFKDKPALFVGLHRKLTWLDDQDRPEMPDEHQAMTTTVREKLNYQQKAIVRYLDAVLQKEKTNQTASADIIVDGNTIASNVPATYLLGLESKLKQVRDVYAKIPTLQVGIDWVKDEQRGVDVWAMRHPKETMKTEKRIVPQILYKATPEHPAQVDKISETHNIGKFTKNVWCGMMTSAEKSAILGKIDKLIRAVKKARQRANHTEIVKATIGKELFDYINS